MKNFRKDRCFLFTALLAVMLLHACKEKEYDTYSYPDVYVALIKVSPVDIEPGAELTIEGNDLDRVKSVRLSNSDGVSVDIPQTAFKTQSNLQITLDVPLDAPVGKVAIITDADKIITWIRQLAENSPVISSLSPEIVAAGEEITIKGKHLDLVSAVLFSKGDASVSVLRENFVFANDDSIKVAIPGNAPVDKVGVITAYNLLIYAEASLTERIVTVSQAKPNGIVVLGTDIIIVGTNLDLVTVAVFGTHPAVFSINAAADSIVLTIPLIAEDSYQLKLVSVKGETVVGNFDLVALHLDYAWDKAHIFFDFDGKDSWWGDCLQTIENDPTYSISGSYFHATGTATAGWYGLFWRNNGDGLTLTGVTVEDWVMKYDINVLGTAITSLKIRLGDFWYVTDLNPNIGGWYTVSVPLSGFKDDNGNGNPITNTDVAALATAGDFGMADGGAGGEYDVLFDNVRFEKIE